MKKPASRQADKGLDYGAIGNGRVLALVDAQGRIVWWCAPRFDSPSLFACLLDEEKGGSFDIQPAAPARRVRREYLTNTNCLRTRFETREGSFEIVDFAPWLPHAHRPDSPLEIHRLVVPVEGTPRIRVRFDPRPDYGREVPKIVPFSGGLAAFHGGPPVFLTMNAPAANVLAGTPLLLDRPRTFTASFGAPSPCVRADDTTRRLDETTWMWRIWVKGLALPDFAPEAVIRSALALRLHMYDDTGAIVAAATTSIPEALGSSRNWDYRYCWLRDSSFVVEAFRRVGCLQEGERFLDFLRNVAANSERLQPVYGLAGEADIEEKILPHLRGYLGHGPVRVGNAASKQVQHDVYGEMVVALEPLLTDPRIVRDDRKEIFELIRRLVDEASRRARQPDTGIWEFRTKLGPHTHSRAMCYVALDRGAKLAKREGHAALAAKWRREAEAIGKQILQRGYNAKLGYFTQWLDGRNADASLFHLGRFGLLPAKDPRFVSTVRNYEKILLRDGLMLRYVNEDDFGKTTSAFLLCSFWWAEALALMGDVDKAERIFRDLLERANSLGLFSEDIDPKTGARLGNFPQAYTHVGVITTAIAIDSAQKFPRNGRRSG